MPSSPTPARVPLKPGPDFNQQTIPVTRQPRRAWFRIHRAGAPAAFFCCLPHHRFSHGKCPFELLYLGGSVQTCLWEYFGEDVFQGRRVISAAKWTGSSLSRVVVPELQVCAVTLERTREAMIVDKASLMAADLSIPQAWGWAVQEHPAGFQGIKYSSRFLDQPCLALFAREGLPAKLHVHALGSLTSLDIAIEWLDQRKAALV